MIMKVMMMMMKCLFNVEFLNQREREIHDVSIRNNNVLDGRTKKCKRSPLACFSKNSVQSKS